MTFKGWRFRTMDSIAARAISSGIGSLFGDLGLWLRSWRISWGKLLDRSSVYRVSATGGPVSPGTGLFGR